MISKEDLKIFLQNEVREADREISQFKQKFDECPGYALRWSKGVFPAR